MRNRWTGLLVALGSVWELGCQGDDVSVQAPSAEAGVDATSPVADAGIEAGERHVFLTANGLTSSELAVVSLDGGKVFDLRYPGFIGTTSVQGDIPFVLMQSADVVARLRKAAPFGVEGSWNVAGADRPDGGEAYADPTSVTPVGNKAYVPRYTRNSLAVLDLTTSPDAGTPAKLIDLARFVHPADGDGIVEMTSSVFWRKRNLVLVTLGRVDRKRVSGDGFTITCTTSQPLLIAIDPTTDAVVPFGPSGAGIELPGYNSVLGAEMVLDEEGDRVWILNAGCNEVQADGGTGAVQRREVDEVSLTEGVARRVLDLTREDFPLHLVRLDKVALGVGFYGAVSRWGIGQAALGEKFTGLFPPVAVHDGRLFGTAQRTLPGDAGTGSDLVTRPVTGPDASAAVLAEDPFSALRLKEGAAFVGGLDIYPRGSL